MSLFVEKPLDPDRLFPRHQQISEQMFIKGGVPVPKNRELLKSYVCDKR